MNPREAIFALAGISTHQLPSHCANWVVWNQSLTPTCGKDSGEAYSEFVENYARNNEKAADIEYVFRCGIGSENTAIPAQRPFNEGFERGHHVHEHVGEEHHQRHKNKN